MQYNQRVIDVNRRRESAFGRGNMVAWNKIEIILRPSEGAYQPHRIGQNIPGAESIWLQKQCQNATLLNLSFGETKCQT